MSSETRTGYKFLTSEMTSKYNPSCKWVVGEWKKHEGPLEMCGAGFHYCREPLDAFAYAYGGMLAVIEARGDEIQKGNKLDASEMRIVKVVDAKLVAVRFAVACARRVLPIFEQHYPNDDRPRKAIEAAEAWLEQPSASRASRAASEASWAASEAASRAARVKADERKWQNETLCSIIAEAPALVRSGVSKKVKEI